ncbi:MAG: hypothetical protein GY801_17820, partial [bacterium]|nr:hypothetical protein [bacterium]
MNIRMVFFDMGGTIDTHRHDRASSLEATVDIRNLLSQAGLDVAHLDTEHLYSIIRAGQTRYRIWREKMMIE